MEANRESEGFNGTSNTTKKSPPREFIHQTQEGQITMAFLLLQAVLIILTNTLVFILVTRYKNLRKKSNYCLISLALSDILAGLVSLPLVLASSSLQGQPSLLAAMDLCQRFLSISTIFHLVVATGERYLKIRNPFRYKYLATSRRIIAVLVSVWFFSLSVALIQLTWMFEPKKEDPHSLSNDLIYAIVCLTALAFLPFLIIIGAYGHMVYIIKEESKARKALTRPKENKIRKSQRRRENERKVLFVYMAMAISFVLGWFPYFITTVLIDLGWVTARLPFWANVVFLSLKFSTAFVNPLLYTFFKADFQKAARDFFKKTTECNRPPHSTTGTLI